MEHAIAVALNKRHNPPKVIKTCLDGDPSEGHGVCAIEPLKPLSV